MEIQGLEASSWRKPRGARIFLCTSMSHEMPTKKFCSCKRCGNLISTQNPGFWLKNFKNTKKSSIFPQFSVQTVISGYSTSGIALQYKTGQRATTSPRFPCTPAPTSSPGELSQLAQLPPNRTCLSNFLLLFSAGQYITIHGLDGAQISNIQNHEGFMAARIGQTSCLSFHPHKVSLAAGFVDNYVCVFSNEK